MNKILQKQVHKFIGSTEDLPESFITLLDEVSATYDFYDKDKKLLENTLQMNNEELELVLREKENLLRLTSQENIEQNWILEQYKNVIDKTLIVSITDIRGMITYVNDNFVNVSGFSRNELIGKSHNIIRHPRNSPQLFEDMWRTLGLKSIWSGMFPNLRKDGSTYYVRATIVPILNSNGEIIEFLALREDVTEQILAHERISTILNNQDSIVILIQEGKGIIDTNEKFFAMFDYESLDDFIQKHQNICELFVEKEGYLSSDDPFWFKKILSHPEETHLVVMMDRYSNERVFSIKVSRVELEHTMQYLATFVDTTELQYTKLAAQEAEKAKSTFLANMSHEIRTPLNGIMGFLQILNQTQLTQQQKKYVGYMNSSVDTLLEIVNDILDFSKLESGKVECEYIKVNPFVDFDHIFQLLYVKAREKHISYLVMIDPAINEYIFASLHHIKQVMLNLISNAIKFTPEQGTVKIELKLIETNGHRYKVRFSVDDTGIGIPEDRIEKIFLPFSQADTSTTRRFGGTGLGLSICNSLINLMGGELKVESKEGCGSKFYFELDLKGCQEEQTISDKLHKYNFVVLSGCLQIQDMLLRHLNNFGIEYKLSDGITHKLDPETVLITTDKHIASEQKDCKVILITEEDKSQLPDAKNILIINNFVEYPSSIYNILFGLDMIHIEKPELASKEKIFLKVLVAEDYELNRILLEELLNRHDIDYDFAFDGQEAVDMCKNKQYDLVLMDINMPNMNGMDATKNIRSLGIDVPIVALTANALESDKEQFMLCGMQDVITKPIKISELERILHKYTNDSLIVTEIKADKIRAYLKSAADEMKLPTSVVIRLFESFLKSTSGWIEKIEEGINTKNSSLILSNTHDLKSGSGTLKLEQIGDIVKQIELKVKNNDFNLQGEFQLLKGYLEAIKGLDLKVI